MQMGVWWCITFKIQWGACKSRSHRVWILRLNMLIVQGVISNLILKRSEVCAVLMKTCCGCLIISVEFLFSHYLFSSYCPCAPLRRSIPNFIVTLCNGNNGILFCSIQTDELRHLSWSWHSVHICTSYECWATHLMTCHCQSTCSFIPSNKVAQHHPLLVQKVQCTHNVMLRHPLSVS